VALRERVSAVEPVRAVAVHEDGGAEVADEDVVPGSADQALAT
jgi:hypothetical protein